MGNTRSKSAGRAWVALDLFRADVDSSELADALTRLSQQVQGVTLLSDTDTVDAPDQSTSVVTAAEPGSASRLQRCEAVLPQDAELVIYGDARLLDPAWQGPVTDVLARWEAGDTALIRGVPITDSLRRVDGCGRFRECVERSGLVVPAEPHMLRRDAVADVAALARSDGGDGSVEAGLLRCPFPVRVVQADPVTARRRTTHR